MTKVPEEFTEALPILQKLNKAGYEAYFVGGSVRDTLLNRPIHDVDIATSAYPAEVKALFNRTVDTGIEHGTVMVLDHGTGYEVTTFRTESGYQDFRRPDKVTFVRSLKEDLKRRDFTINALAMSADGKITDLFGGIADMKKKIIRAVGMADKRFHEDALRMMRAIRFASQLDFVVEDNTLTGIKDNHMLLRKIAVERCHTEFVKMMLGADPSMGLKMMIETELFLAMPGFENQKVGLEKLMSQSLKLKNEAQVWAIIAFYFELNISQTQKLLRNWKSSVKLIKEVTLTYQVLLKIANNQVNDFDLFEAQEVGVKNAVDLISYTDSTLDGDKIVQRFKRLPITEAKQLKISGGELIKQKVLSPSPLLGEILKILVKQVVQGKVVNQKDQLIEASKKIKAQKLQERSN